MQQDGLKYTFVNQQQEVRGNRECLEFTGDMESLLRSFTDRMINTEMSPQYLKLLTCCGLSCMAVESSVGCV